MANQLLPSFKELLLGGDIDLANDTIKFVLLDTADYTFNTAHNFLDDVTAGARIATGTLASKTITSGVFDAADLTLDDVTGDQAEAGMIYKDTGSEATSPLIAYLDTATGFAVTPNGGDIVITWSNGASKIFAL